MKSTLVCVTNYIFSQGELDEMFSETQLAEEKCKKAMIDAARLADELRLEQDCSQTFERERKLLECQAKDIQVTG